MTTATIGVRLTLALGLTAALTLGLHGCTGAPAASDGGIRRYWIPPSGQAFPQGSGKPVDVLFVIDNSDGMGDAQEALVAAFPTLLKTLEHPELDHGLPDLHLGVVSTDLGAGSYGLPTCERPGGDEGLLQQRPRGAAGCPFPLDPFLSHANGRTNVKGGRGTPREQLEQAFACIARLGTGGCGFEQPLEAARRALDPKLKRNPGFVRKDALLAVVFFTDEDDCSTKDPTLFDPAHQGLTDPLGPLGSFRCFEFGIRCDVNDRQAEGPRARCVPAGTHLYRVEDYVAFFKALKPAGQLILVAIAGPPTPVAVKHLDGTPVLAPSCFVSNTAIAQPAIRLAAVLKRDPRLEADALFHSMCEQDFRPLLEQLGTRLARKVRAECVDAPLVTTGGGLACAKGDLIGTNSEGALVICQASCLDRVRCTVAEFEGPPDAETRGVEIPQCPKALFDEPSRTDCGATCPCWRFVSRPAGPSNRGCDPAVNGTPHAFQILRKTPPPAGAVAYVDCPLAEFDWGMASLANLRQCL